MNSDNTESASESRIFTLEASKRSLKTLELASVNGEASDRLEDHLAMAPRK